MAGGMRVLVTGGTGYLGSAIVRALSHSGCLPVVFARRATGSGLPGEHLDGDVRARADVDRAVRHVDAVCHAAALVSVWRRRRREFDDVNGGGLRMVLDACRARPIPRIVYTSSFLALPPADAAGPLRSNDYQRTKVDALEVTRAAARDGLPIVTLFPGVVYGPGAMTEGNLVGRLVHDHLAGRRPGLIGADRPWSYAFIDDVAAAHVAAVRRGRPGDEFVLGGVNVTQMQLFEILRELTGARLPRRIPFAAAYAVGLVEELRAGLTGAPPLLTRGVVQIFRHDWSLDSRRSLLELG